MLDYAVVYYCCIMAQAKAHDDPCPLTLKSKHQKGHSQVHQFIHANEMKMMPRTGVVVRLDFKIQDLFY